MIKAIVLLSSVFFLSLANFSTRTLTIKLSSSSLVSARTVSASSKFASTNTSSSNPSPLIIIESFNSLARYSALSLSFSTILTLVVSKVSSIFFAKLNPIFPPPIIKIFFEIFSKWPKASSVSGICEELIIK